MITDIFIYMHIFKNDSSLKRKLNTMYKLIPKIVRWK